MPEPQINISSEQLESTDSKGEIRGKINYIGREAIDSGKRFSKKIQQWFNFLSVIPCQELR